MTKITALTSGSLIVSLGLAISASSEDTFVGSLPFLSLLDQPAAAAPPWVGPGDDVSFAALVPRDNNAVAPRDNNAVTSHDNNEVLQQYCVRCHNPRRLRGNLTLDEFDVDQALSYPATTEKIIHKLRAGMMPPSGTRRPEEAVLDELASYLESTMDAAYAASPNPGRRTFQRLNRAEYGRSVEALLAVTVDVDGFLPTETISENFDNIADVQNLSVTVMQGYLRAADHVSRLAVGDPTASTSTTTYKIPRTANQTRHTAGTPLGTRGGISITHTFPADGDYSFKLEFFVDPVGFLFGNTSRDEFIEVSVDGERAALLPVDRWMSESDPGGARIETPSIHVRAGPHNISAAFIQKTDGPTDDLVRLVDHTLADTQIGSAYGITTMPHLRDLGIAGPHTVTGISDTPSRRIVFSCRPTSPDEERPCAEEIIERLGATAYRRSLKDKDLADLLRFYDAGREEGGFESGIRVALQAILASPHFVFRLEEVPAGVAPGEVYRISDTDLASRLSFFLWGTPPDRPLLEVAKLERLRDPRVLRAQTLRMLEDPRSKSLSTRFAYQWLRLQDLEKIHPDAQLYPYFDQTLAAALLEETERFFHSLIQEDRDLMELITADYTFVNERVARHYGIPGVTGNEFRRVSLLDENRRGLLGHGSILTLTSHANRTSPVLRGKWVMEVLMGSPPPPPPPDVPDLEATAGSIGERDLTTRERMEKHRANPSCNSCHVVIDPIGLALDNFDVTGAWRIKENGAPLDATGELYDGTPLRGPPDLHKAIVARPSIFVRTFTKNLMAYALGRRIQPTDMPAIRMIERSAASEGNRMSMFILGVIQSPAFQMSRVEVTAQGKESEKQ